jgi:hypothetical protein
MTAQRIGLPELEAIRRERRKTLAAISREVGIDISSVWRCLHGKSLSLKNIARVARSIGVPLHRIDFESLLREQVQDARSANSKTVEPNHGHQN